MSITGPHHRNRIDQPQLRAGGDSPRSVVDRALINAELLRVLRYELTHTFQPELKSDYAHYVAAVMGQMLDYMTDWASGDGYPDIDAARAALLDGSQAQSPASGKFAPELDDPGGLDEALASAIAVAANSGDDAALARLAGPVGAIDDALYTDQSRRHELHTKSNENYIAQIDPELTRERFDRYARAQLGIDDPVDQIHRIPGGHSKDTFLLTLRSGRKIIVRRDFPFGPVNSSAVDEFGLLRHLFNHGMPVAAPIAAERDTAWLGQPFLLMERIPGSDAHVAGMADRETGRQISFRLAEILAELHAMDPGAAGLTSASPNPRDEVGNYLASWRQWWDLNRIHPSSLGEAAFAWLERNVPDDIPRVVIVHGDARPGNMLFDNGAVTALLDWEFAHAGDAAEDLQYAKGFVEPFVNWEEFYARYRAAGGAPVSEAGSRYYDVFRSWRNMVCTDVSWGGFIRRDYPAFKMAAQGVVYKRYLAQALAKSMQTVSWVTAA